MPRRRGGGGGGRRPGARREEESHRNGSGGSGGGGGGERRGRGARPKKTQEELDAEMADYFNPGGDVAAASTEDAGANSGKAVDDVDMIE